MKKRIYLYDHPRHLETYQAFSEDIRLTFVPDGFAREIGNFALLARYASQGAPHLQAIPMEILLALFVFDSGKIDDNATHYNVEALHEIELEVISVSNRWP